jgi:hypothetical protein
VPGLVAGFNWVAPWRKLHKRSTASVRHVAIPNLATAAQHIEYEFPIDLYPFERNVPQGVREDFQLAHG